MKIFITAGILSMAISAAAQAKLQIQPLSPQHRLLQRGKGVNIGHGTTTYIIDGVQTPGLSCRELQSEQQSLCAGSNGNSKYHRQAINDVAANTLQEIIALSPVVYRKTRNKEPIMRGGNLLYVVDGMVMNPLP